MKRKTIMSLAIITALSSLIVSCGKTEKVTADAETQVGTDYDATEDSQVELLPWTQLADLETHPELRTAFEELLGVTKEDDGTKSGIVYTDENGDRTQNNTLYNALGNTSFTIDNIRDAEQIKKMEEIASNEYTDIEDNQSIPAVVNAYFELLPDQTEGQFDGDSTISRAQAMALVMRAITPVNEAHAPETNQDFTAKVGESQYTDFAAPMNEYSYINTENGLTDKTFNTTMSRGEYIYMLTKSIYNESYAKRMDRAAKTDESLSEDVTLTMIKDAGDINYADAIKNPDGGLPTEMHKTLARAVSLGFITEDDLNWDEAITKSDAVTLFIDAVDFAYANSMFVTDSDGTPEATNSEGLTVDEAIALDVEYTDKLVEDYEGDIITRKEAYAKEQGADELDGGWLVYFYGSAAGNKRSYAINVRTGEKIVAGPYSFYYGTSMDDNGAQPFWGSDKTYPGDEFPEFEENMTLYITGQPAHTNGQ